MFASSPESVIFTGRSGCGKGTQSELLKTWLVTQDSSRPVLYLQTGKLFRDFLAQNESATSLRMRELMKTGARQPDFLAIWNWTNELINRLVGNQHLIIDGAPRSLAEAQLLAGALAFYGRSNVTVIHLKVSHDWAFNHLKGRGRADDVTDAMIEARLSWFETEVQPAIDFFRSHSEYKFIEVDGEISEAEVHQSIISQLTV